MTVLTPKFGMGASVLRVEDSAFITGKGRYTDDFAPEAVLHGYVLRSPIANGSFKITSVDAARSAPGVHLVLIGEKLEARQSVRVVAIHSAFFDRAGELQELACAVDVTEKRGKCGRARITRTPRAVARLRLRTRTPGSQIRPVTLWW